MDSNPDPNAEPTARNQRISFSNLVRPSMSSQRRPSFAARWRRPSNSTAGGNDDQPSIPFERPPIPSAFEPTGEVYSTPLPALSMIVLSITMLGEFLSANVATPFLLFMVKGFGELEDEAEVAFWTGIIVSMFFLTQFATSLLWATVAERHGRRAVLVVSLAGSAVTCALFGTTTSIKQAIAVRLLQGIFGGAVGVARGSVAFITDPSNEGRAYAIIGFSWGLGGVAGAIIGGAFERPADKWPGVFMKIPLFVEYPYLLPGLIAASITLTGSILSLFLNYEGGPRQGAIQLPDKEDQLRDTTAGETESAPPTPRLDGPSTPNRGSIGRRLSKKFSGYFTSGETQAAAQPEPEATAPIALGPPRSRNFSRTSRYNGSAYGYSTASRSRVASVRSTGIRRGSTTSTLRRRNSSVGPDGLPQDDPVEMPDMNFAQRLLMANEHAVTNIADLWVAAAMNVDNEEVFEDDSDLGAGDDEQPFLDSEDAVEDGPEQSPLASRRPSSNVPAGRSLRVSSAYGGSPGPRRYSQAVPNVSDGMAGRRFSSNVPAIFAHPGVKVPSAVLDSQQLAPTNSRLGEPATPTHDGLQRIAESRVASWVEPSASDMDLESGPSEKQPSLIAQLPMLIIIQYGALALHSTTHDQIFMSYLVTDFEAGGLNLNAGHFAQLIALMCLAQIAYQFYLYPNIGPPRGRFSHLSMYRLGCFLFIPSYLTVVLYHPFASAEDDGNFFVMACLAFSTAIRYCAICFSYTAVSILLNYMTPPHLVGYANGIAQSIVSLARFFGPIIGGLLWSVSIEGNPNGYPWGFVACAGFCFISILHSYFIR